MSGGGQNTTTTSNAPPQQFLDAYSKVNQQAQNVASVGYQPYPGQIVAGMSPDQQAGIAGVHGAQYVADPFINSAAQHIDNATAPIWNDPNVTHADPWMLSNLPGASISQLNQASGPAITDAASRGSAGIYDASRSFDPASIRQFQDPYTDEVVAATQRDFQNQNDIQNQGIVGNAISSGAWGGDRSAVAQGIVAGQQARAQDPIIANLRSQGYQQATQAAAEQARQRMTGATSAGQLGLTGATAQSGALSDAAKAGLGFFGSQQGAQLGATQANRWLESQAGAGMGGLGTEALGTRLTGANALLGTGGLEQQQAQAELNVPYSQYLAAQAYPFQTTGWLANIAEGLGGASGGTGTTTSPGPSVGSQVAGAGIAGAGLLGVTGAFGGESTDGGWLSNMWNGSVAPTAVADARGGRIPHRGPGGGLPDSPISGAGIGNISPVPGADGMGVAPASHGQMNILKNYGQTATTTGGDSEIGSLLKTAGTIATAIYAPYALPAANAFNQNVHFARGGIVPFPRHLSRAPGTGIFSNDNGYHPTRLAAGGVPQLSSPTFSVTISPSTSGSGGVPQLTSTGGGGITGSPFGVSDYLATQRAGQSFAPPPHYVPPPEPAKESSQDDPAKNIFYDPGQSGGYTMDSTGGMARGGIIGRDEGGDIPPEEAPMPPAEEAPVDINQFDNAGPNPITSPDKFGIPTPGVTPRGGATDPTTVAPRPQMGRGSVPTSPGPGYVPPPPEFVPLIAESSAKYGIDPRQLSWLLSTESRWNPNAYNRLSGTMGLGQFKPGTAQEMGINPWDVRQAIDGSAGYLRKMLDKNGGDYERAIARYGTFSTGQGPEADMAVRQRYRAFMQAGQGSMARGGGIVSLAPGGGLTYGDPSNPIGEPMTMGAFPTLNERPGTTPGATMNDPAVAPPGSDPMLPPPGGGILVPGARPSPTPFNPNTVGNILPNAPVPADEPGPEGGGGGGGGGDTGAGIVTPPVSPAEQAAKTSPDEKTEDPKISPWQKLMNVGLGIMSGTSPHAAVNIGKGALTGIALSDKEQQTLEQATLRKEVAKQNADWRKAQGIRADTKEDRLGRQGDAALAIKQQNADQKAKRDQAYIEHQAWLAVNGDAKEDRKDRDLAERMRAAGVRELQRDRVIDNQGREILRKEARDAVWADFKEWQKTNGDAKQETQQARLDALVRNYGLIDEREYYKVDQRARTAAQADLTRRDIAAGQRATTERGQNMRSADAAASREMRVGAIMRGQDMRSATQAASQDIQRNRATSLESYRAQMMDWRDRTLAETIKQRGITNDLAAQKAVRDELNKAVDQQIRFLTGMKDPFGTRPPLSTAELSAGVQRLRSNARTLVQPRPTVTPPAPAATPPATPPAPRPAAAAPAQTQDWQTAPDGTPYIQGGVTYIKRGNIPARWPKLVNGQEVSP